MPSSHSFAGGREPDSANHDPGRPSGESQRTEDRVLFEEALKDLNQPTTEADLPKGILSVPLFRHQKMALAWMMQKEKGKGVCDGGILADDQGLGKTISMIALIQIQKPLQHKHKSEKMEVSTSRVKTQPFYFEELDEKNFCDTAPASTASSVKTEPFVKGKVKVENVEDILTEMSSSRSGLCGEEPAAGTLVVCPASVLRQWARELDEKVTEESKLSVLIYHGSRRTLDPSELAKYDVVLTTFAIVSMEVPKQPIAGQGKQVQFKKRKRKQEDDPGRQGTLAKVRWFRVILDEAHIIKNHKTKVARACFSLRANTRWCLSGTPLQNEIADLYSYFRFLKHDPYSNYKKFAFGIKKPKCGGSGYQKIRIVLKAIMLRRTKDTVIGGKPILDLPPKSINLKKVNFSDEEWDYYFKLEQKYRSRFEHYIAEGTVKENWAIILLMLLRLRQACDHPILVKDGYNKIVKRESLDTAMTLRKGKLQSLLGVLKSVSAVCGVCRDTPELGVVTNCGHVFCFECVFNHLTELETTTCPEAGCNEKIGVGSIFTEEILKECLSDDIDGDGDSYSSRGDDNEEFMNPKNKSSSKVKAALQCLKSCCKPWYEFGAAGSDISNPEKAIVFSQWTSMLDLVEEELQHTGLRYQRLDGTMSLNARDIAIKDFNTKPDVVVILMSLKAGNLGLNMVAANHVILLDPWWNPTTEDQAVDRAHRIGQTRPVTVTRLITQDTVEDRVLTLQESKRTLVSAVIGGDHSQGSTTGLTVRDLKILFNVR